MNVPDGNQMDPKVSRLISKENLWYAVSCLIFLPPVISLSLYTRGYEYSNFIQFSLIWVGIFMTVVVAGLELAITNMKPNFKVISICVTTVVLFVAVRWFFPTFISYASHGAAKHNPIMFIIGTFICGLSLQSAVQIMRGRTKRKNLSLKGENDFTGGN